MLKPPVPSMSTFQLARPSAAERSAPTSAPPPKQADRMPNTSGPASSVSEASSGRMTWKLKPTVLTTVTIASTSRICGCASTQEKPSRMPRIIVGGSPLRSSGTSSSFRIISSPIEHGEEA